MRHIFVFDGIRQNDDLKCFPKILPDAKRVDFIDYLRDDDTTVGHFVNISDTCLADSMYLIAILTNGNYDL